MPPFDAPVSSSNGAGCCFARRSKESLQATDRPTILPAPPRSGGSSGSHGWPRNISTSRSSFGRCSRSPPPRGAGRGRKSADEFGSRVSAVSGRSSLDGPACGGDRIEPGRDSKGSLTGADGTVGSSTGCCGARGCGCCSGGGGVLKTVWVRGGILGAATPCALRADLDPRLGMCRLGGCRAA